MESHESQSWNLSPDIVHALVLEVGQDGGMHIYFGAIKFVSGLYFVMRFNRMFAVMRLAEQPQYM